MKRVQRLPLPICPPLLVVAALGISAIAARAAECPPSRIQLTHASDPFISYAPVLDSTLYGPSFVSHATYDLIQGTLALSITPVAGESVFVSTADAYDLLGLAPGTIVTIDAVLDFEGGVGTPGCSGPDCAATFDAFLFDEFFFSQRQLEAPAHTGRTSEQNSLTLPVRFTAGRPNIIGCAFAMRTAPGGYHEGEWTGRLRFSGVPAGARVVSCQGYGDTAVPARPATWGKLKAMYR